MNERNEFCRLRPSSSEKNINRHESPRGELVHPVNTNFDLLHDYKTSNNMSTRTSHKQKKRSRVPAVGHIGDASITTLPTKDEMDKLGGEVLEHLSYEDDELGAISEGGGSDQQLSSKLDSHSAMHTSTPTRTSNVNKESQASLSNDKKMQSPKAERNIIRPVYFEHENRHDIDKNFNNSSDYAPKTSYDPNGHTVFQDVKFPPLRSVLWDRTPTGNSYIVSAKEHIPALVFRRAALASLYHHASHQAGYFAQVLDSDDEYDHTSIETNGKIENTERHKAVNDTMKGTLSSSPIGNGVGILIGCPTYTTNDGKTELGEWVGGRWQAKIDRFTVRKSSENNTKVRETAMDEFYISVVSHRPSNEQIAAARARVVNGSAGVGNIFHERSERCLHEPRLCFTSEEYEILLENTLNRFRIRGPMEPTQYLCTYACCVPLPDERLLLRAEILLPALSLHFTPVAPLSTLLTPLARQLERWAAITSEHRASEVATSSPPKTAPTNCDALNPTAWGFLTLNQTRKAVFLLENDPMAYNIPVVGVWLRGSALSPSQGTEDKRIKHYDWQSMIDDPLLWSVCLRYIHNEHLKEKVSPIGSSQTFLVAIYPKDGASLYPQFLECKYSLEVQAEDLRDVGLQPRTFVQLECSLEVDVSHRNTLLRSDEVCCKFYHVENAKKLQAFELALAKHKNKFANAETDTSDPKASLSRNEDDKIRIDKRHEVKNVDIVDSIFFMDAVENKTTLNAPTVREESTNGLYPCDPFANSDSLSNHFQKGEKKIVETACLPNVEFGNQVDSLTPQKGRLENIFGSPSGLDKNYSPVSPESNKSRENERLLDIVAAQQEQITMMQKQIASLQQLVTDCMRFRMTNRSEDSPILDTTAIKNEAPSLNTNEGNGKIKCSTEHFCCSPEKTIIPVLEPDHSHESGIDCLNDAESADHDSVSVTLDGQQTQEKELTTYESKPSKNETARIKAVEVSNEKYYFSIVQKTDKTSTTDNAIVNVKNQTSQETVQYSGIHFGGQFDNGDDLFSEMDTNYGIPRIVMQRPNSLSNNLSQAEVDTSVIVDSVDPEEDEWLAKVEQKYLEQIRAENVSPV